MSKQFVWLITGTSSGIGRDLTLAALRRGDKVIATTRSRSLSKLADLKAQGADVLELDVTSPLDKLKQVAEKAVAIHGRVDVLVNNAGYILVGALEETTPEETLDQFNTNVFGALNVARAFLPYMRERKAGTIIWLGSVGGWRSGPGYGLYSATKYTARALSEALNAEISPLGLRSICIELGYFRTDFLTPDNRSAYTTRIADYEQSVGATSKRLEGIDGKQPGDPKKAVEVMVDLVRGEGVADGKEIPLVVDLGSDCHQTVRDICQSTIERLDKWESVARSTDF
ncbi:NAD(P)-binding protein [Neolentinus lepideus HHB14362 ss-1]|uniref:NAD(P)-binding protein n=1 Tax=Neolentinus lepideus HHB14362 ss-1 TaxID=1314782 RepID=A0A165MW66_9AGAM|nr:NAD(P)-binding protein [Neolentinus lepideus HHB14362 ss-1]